MKLFVNQTSPYARKVRVVVSEKNLASKIQLVDVDPWTDPPPLLAASPLSKVPVLLLDSGTALTESDSVVRYLDELEPAPAMLPSSGEARIETLSRVALAHGMIDAAFDAVIERRRPAVAQWEEWVARQTHAVERGLAVATNWPDGSSPQRFDLGDVSLACLLGYLDFRHGALDWRKKFPGLDSWYDAVSRRPSIANTAPDKPVG